VARRFKAKQLAVVVAPSDTTAPTVPTNVTASSLTASGFTVSWSASTDAVGVTGYDVQIDGASYATPTGTSVAVTGRAASTAYSVRVRARDAAGNWSALSTAITATTSAAATPVNLFTTQTPTSTDLNDNTAMTLSTRFVSDADGSVTGVRFYRAASSPTSAIGLLYSDAARSLPGPRSGRCRRVGTRSHSRPRLRSRQARTTALPTGRPTRTSAPVRSSPHPSSTIT
jgi:chitodextrinase